MSTTTISKQDYLKKYLSGSYDKKKKKKKKVTHNSIIKSKIIDDDIDLNDIKAVDSDELEIFDTAEEAPQVVGIIDDRPEEVRLMSEYKNTKKWRIVADEYEDVKVTAIGNSDKSDENKEDDDESMSQKESSTWTHNSKKCEPRSTVKKIDSNPRTGQEDSPSRKIKKEKSDSDISPPRKTGKHYDSDISPPRKTGKHYDSDISPPRKTGKHYDSDISPRRKSKKSYEPSSREIKKENSDSDASPPRKSRKHSLVPRRSKWEKSDSGLSPRRKSDKKYNSDASPPKKSKSNYDSDQSPRRKNEKSNSSNSHRRKHDHHSDSSPHKRSKKHREKDSASYTRDKRRRRSKSPEGTSSHRESGKSKNSENSSRTRSRDESHSKDGGRSKNTLSGRKSGLQNAEELRREIEVIKAREKEVKADASGKDEAVVVRDKRTGRRINPKEEARKRREKEEKEADKIAQYAVWGKGVKQVQDSKEKLKDDLYEMSKPLARYADDKDLDDMLKEKEWDGDPMLNYMRKKKKKEENGESSKRPQYEGPYFPNRYGIKPGHRWDGVDRSNGFEKRWFEEQNARKAREEEAFKWSTSDM